MSIGREVQQVGARAKKLYLLSEAAGLVLGQGSPRSCFQVGSDCPIIFRLHSVYTNPVLTMKSYMMTCGIICYKRICTGQNQPGSPTIWISLQLLFKLLSLLIGLVLNGFSMILSFSFFLDQAVSSFGTSFIPYPYIFPIACLPITCLTFLGGLPPIYQSLSIPGFPCTHVFIEWKRVVSFLVLLVQFYS